MECEVTSHIAATASMRQDWWCLNDLVVLAMCADPEPMDAARDRETKCSVIEANTHAVELAVSDRFEVQ